MRTFLIILLFSNVGLSQIDGIKYGIVLDGVYTVENPPDTVYFHDFFGKVRNDNLILDNSWQTDRWSKDFDLKIEALQEKYEQKKVIDFENCTYINLLQMFDDKSDIKTEIFFSGNKNDSILKPLLPNSLRTRIDTSDISTVKGVPAMFLKEDFSFPYEEYLTPFYFKQTPVTNGEYREFVNHVRDSISRELLFLNLENLVEALEYLILSDSLKSIDKTEFNLLSRQNIREHSHLNYETDFDELWEPEHREILSKLYFPRSEQFYDKYTLDVNNLIYSFKHENGKNKQIKIYPDTTKWGGFSVKIYSNPVGYMYFWHPAFSDYPVVGVSYDQVQAFLHWKTQQSPIVSNSKGERFKVKCQLPNEVQWDIASTMNIRKKSTEIFGHRYFNFSDDNWVTDLHLEQETTNEIYNYSTDEQNDTLVEVYKRSSIDFKGDFTESDSTFILDQFNIFSVYPKKRKKLFYYDKINRDHSGFVFMGGIVSEWLDVDYNKDWKPIFDLRQHLLAQLKGKDGQLQLHIEKYYDSNFNEPGGKMIRGSNWFDARVGVIYDKNVAGLNAKCFAQPSKSFATVGFRYVVVLEKVE